MGAARSADHHHQLHRHHQQPLPDLDLAARRALSRGRLDLPRQHQPGHRVAGHHRHRLSDHVVCAAALALPVLPCGGRCGADRATTPDHHHADQRYPGTSRSTPPRGAIDYYRFVVSSNSARAQFEINGPSADVTLVARKGLPLPDLASFDYISANPSTNDELIVVFTNSTPVALLRGRLVPLGGQCFRRAGDLRDQSHRMVADPVGPSSSPTPPSSRTALCLTWTSLPGVRYHVEGLTSLGSTNWVTVSPVITATDYSTTWCVPLPSPYQFFRVVEGGGADRATHPDDHHADQRDPVLQDQHRRRARSITTASSSVPTPRGRSLKSTGHRRRDAGGAQGTAAARPGVL